MKIKLFKACILFSLFNTISFAELNTVRAFPNLQFDQPIDLQSPNDNSNRIFILEQEGEVFVFQNLDSISDATQFLDLRDKVEFQGEMGLLGLAFHPNFANNGYFYVNYITLNPRRTVIARYEVSSTDSNTANGDSEMIILEINQPYNNHNGGQITFGPDGFLYIGMGDGGSGGDPLNHGQNLSTLHGAMLRIDIDNVSDINNYVIPFDNPYINNNEGHRQEIYAHGFRNPWRFSFDDFTGNCWIADVGQDEYEEISILEHGGNYGWNIMEGFHCFNPPTNCDTSGLILPIYEYDHSIGESITGGYVYRGTMLPSLIGKYIFADFEYGDIYALEYNDANNFDVSSIGNLGPYSVTSFGVDQNNEIYICKLNGEIYKIIDSESPLGPVISTIDNQEINEDEPTTLEVIASGGDELTYFVESDTSSMPVYMDGSSIAIGLETNWSGTGTITVTVTNENDLSDTTSFEVVVLPVNDAPGPFNLISPLVDSLFINNDNLFDSTQFLWEESIDPDGDTIKYIFQFYFYNYWGDFNVFYEDTLNNNGILLPNDFITNIIIDHHDTLWAEIAYEYFSDNPYYPVFWGVIATDGIESFGNVYICCDYPGETGAYMVVDLTGLDTSGLNYVKEISMPYRYTLRQNYPNPFNPITTLEYDLPKDSFVDITIYDMLGNVVNNLVNTNQSSGYKTVQWKATNNQGEPVSAGVYLYKIQTGDFVYTKKMMLLK